MRKLKKKKKLKQFKKKIPYCVQHKAKEKDKCQIKEKKNQS